jgi:hypothetical protein
MRWWSFTLRGAMPPYLLILALLAPAVVTIAIDRRLRRSK